MQFIAEAARRFTLKAKSVVRDELKCDALITDLNGWGNRLAYQPLRAECLDYVDTHFYVDSPEMKKKGAGRYPLSTREKCENPVQNGMLAATGLAPMRIFGKPFVLSEFNYCCPGRFRALGNLAFGGMADVQLERGHSPMMMRSGKASVTLACEGAGAKVFALADDGRRLCEVPSKLENGALAFTADIAADPAAATIYYEVEMR